MDSLPADEANATREENLLGDASDVSGEDVIPALPHEVRLRVSYNKIDSATS